MDIKIMRKLLAIIGIIALFIIYDDIREEEHKREIRRIKSLQNSPDPMREVDHWDWENKRWIYKTPAASQEKLDWEFPPSLDSTLVEPEEDYGVYVDPIITPYFTTFISYYLDYKPRVNWEGPMYLRFERNLVKNRNKAAECAKFNNYRVISIDPEFWVTYPEYREAVLMHECGHCFMDRPHNDNLVEVGNTSINYSLMHSDLGIFGPTYLLHKKYYIKELFN